MQWYQKEWWVTSLHSFDPIPLYWQNLANGSILGVFKETCKFSPRQGRGRYSFFNYLCCRELHWIIQEWHMGCMWSFYFEDIHRVRTQVCLGDIRSWSHSPVRRWCRAHCFFNSLWIQLNPHGQMCDYYRIQSWSMQRYLRCDMHAQIVSIKSRIIAFRWFRIFPQFA